MKKFEFQKGMIQVCYALIPCTAVSIFLFGWRSLALLAVAIIVGGGTEALFTLRAGKPVTSAVLVSSMIFALSLPPAVPLWMCAVGIAVGIGIGKMAFGGFGRNVFNPAMVGRCFLYISFPLHMTNRWAEPFRGGPAGLLAWAPAADGMTGATPLEIIRAGGESPLSGLILGSTG
ncbi:RnfABCDGE type electron transport complex subunit D, partial [Candidatus Moduliflexota bacterium]